MTPGAVFSLVNLVALLIWLALIIRPRHPLVLRFAGQVVPLFFAVVYTVIVFMRLGRVDGDFNSLAGVASLFRDPWCLLAGWVHYLAFDLLIGAWEVRDAATRNLPPWRVVPCLVLTFMFGPAGWLVYQAVRSIPVRSRKPADQTVGS